MPIVIENPTIVAAAGSKPKRIEEYVGARELRRGEAEHRSHGFAGGWREPGQRPEFREITVLLRGLLRVEHARGALDVRAGQAVVANPAEWVRYSTPEPDGAEYIAICLPAFAPTTVHRDPEE
jgi:hypothetical protein